MPCRVNSRCTRTSITAADTKELPKSAADNSELEVYDLGELILAVQYSRNTLQRIPSPRDTVRIALDSKDPTQDFTRPFDTDIDDSKFLGSDMKLRLPDLKNLSNNYF